jgi:hypothetical protein
MARKRPTVVTVMAILNIVFGSLGLLCYLCAGAGFLILFAAINQAGPQDRGVQALKELWAEVSREVPWMGAYFVGSMIFSLLMAILLLVSGIGLLNMKSWARALAIFYSLITIITQIVVLWLQLAYINPLMLRVNQNLMARNPAFQPGNDPFGGGLMSNNLWSVIGAVIGMTYAVVLLIMMLLPSVSAAFSGGRPPDEYDLERGAEDDEDFDRERRRREEWNE